MLLRIVGALVVIWIAFVVIGWVFEAFTTLLLIAGIVTLGVVGYGAIKGRKSGQIKP